MTKYWILALLIELTFRVITKNRLKPSVIVGTMMYGVILVIVRFVTLAINTYKRVEFEKSQRKPQRPRLPTRSTDITSSYSLNPFEVVLHSSRRPIKVDFKKHHTLIAGMTGFGKTNIINLILVQLFGKGVSFSDLCDVYLFDLKGDCDDYLHLWKPLLKGYYSITEDRAGIGGALNVLEAIANEVHTGEKDKHIIVIIDEVAVLTAHAPDKRIRTWGKATLGSLASKLRSRGTLIAATQYPKHDVLPLEIRSNLDRKIGLGVDDRIQADLIWRTIPSDETWPVHPGEFLIREPGRRGLRAGRAMLVRLPEDIERIVGNVMVANGQDDKRLMFFAEIAVGLNVGASIVGVNRRIKDAKELGQDHIPQAKMVVWYRNFALAGALAPPERRGQQYKLAKPYTEALICVRGYINRNEWKEEPESCLIIESTLQ